MGFLNYVKLINVEPAVFLFLFGAYLLDVPVRYFVIYSRCFGCFDVNKEVVLRSHLRLTNRTFKFNISDYGKGHMRVILICLDQKSSRDFVLTKICYAGSHFFGNVTYPKEV